ncbi:MAG: bifunctional oligoribonuclease/PAP phosphatase NrnA [Vallitaleaceae bacterium]|nr:bifunctional oligoribonuclease/PAP phosphatase NrnA [Vallitaleaceae bacterium]
MRIGQVIDLFPLDEQVYITGHVHPDGDCLGATLGLGRILTKLGYQVQVILEEAPEKYAYLTGHNQIVDLAKYQKTKEKMISKPYNLIIMDSGDLTRIEPFMDLFSYAKKHINIDHHVSNTHFAHYNYVYDHASSTCEIVGQMLGMHLDDLDFQEYRGLLDEELAACLYTGLIYDTGIFKHDNTTSDTHRIAARLVGTGVDYTSITNRLFFTRSKKAIKAMEIALNHLVIHEAYSLSSTIISYKDLQENALEKGDTEGVVSMLSEIEDVLVSVFFLELAPDQFKVSFRSNSTIDVCEIAKKFKGGGHVKASGCSINGDYQTIHTLVVEELKKSYERHY